MYYCGINSAEVDLLAIWCECSLCVLTKELVISYLLGVSVWVISYLLGGQCGSLVTCWGCQCGSLVTCWGGQCGSLVTCWVSVWVISYLLGGSVWSCHERREKTRKNEWPSSRLWTNIPPPPILFVCDCRHHRVLIQENS